jgi:cell division protein FtsB
MLAVLISVLISIVGTVINYLYLSNDVKSEEKEVIKLRKKKIAKKLITLQSIVALNATIFAGYLNALENKQQDTLLQYQILNNSISANIKSKVAENNLLENQNIALTDSIHKLIYGVNNLINEIQTKENLEFSKNAITGLLQSEFINKKDTVKLIFGDYEFLIPSPYPFKQSDPYDLTERTVLLS